MSVPDARTRLQDLLDAIDQIDAFTRDKTFSDYAASAITQRAVERCIEILSEAARHLPPELKAARPEIPWRNVADVGNVFRHAYSSVDTMLVWRIVAEHLPPLRTAAEALLRDLDPSSPR